MAAIINDTEINIHTFSKRCTNDNRITINYYNFFIKCTVDLTSKDGYTFFSFKFHIPQINFAQCFLRSNYIPYAAMFFFCSLPRSCKMRSSVWSSNSRLTSEARHALLLGWDDWLYRLPEPHCQRWDGETKNVTCEQTYRRCCTDSSRLFTIKITTKMKRIERRSIVN